MTVPVLHVRRHEAHVRGVGADPRPVPLDRLAGELTALIGMPGGDGGEGGLWFLPRLDVRVCWLPGAGDPPVRLLARTVLARLRAVLDDDPAQVPGARWFPDRTCWIAQWLADLAHDGTAGRWEYDELGHAQGDVVGVAERSPGELLAALRSLPGAELDVLLDALRPEVASRVAAAIADPAAGDIRPPQVAVCVRALQIAGRLPPEPRSATLAVAVAVAVGVGDAAAPDARPSPRTLNVCADLAVLALASRDATPRDLAGLAAAVAAADWPAVAALAGAPIAAAVAGWAPSDRRAVADVLVRGAAGSAPDDDGPADTPRPVATEPAGRTPFGGMFLLLPLLAELPWRAASRGWPGLPLDGRPGPLPATDPAADVVPADRVLAALAVAGVLAPDRAGLVLADPWLRLALDLPPLDPDAVAGWAGQVSADAAESCTSVLTDAAARHADGFTRDLADESMLLRGLPRPAGGAVRAAAAALLRELSYRLPGMATASAGSPAPQRARSGRGGPPGAEPDRRRARPPAARPAARADRREPQDVHPARHRRPAMAARPTLIVPGGARRPWRPASPGEADWQRGLAGVAGRGAAPRDPPAARAVRAELGRAARPVRHRRAGRPPAVRSRGP